MALTKERKSELVDVYTGMFEKCQGVIFADNKGLSVADMTQLRKKIRAAEGECRITKNRLVRIALGKAGLPTPPELLVGATVAGFAYGNLPGVAKVIADFAKDHERLLVRGGLLGNTVLNAVQVKALAELPPLPVVRAQFLGLLSAPATRIVGALAGSVRQIVNVVKAYADKDAAPAAA